MKFTFSSENVFYGRKESYLIKYYLTRSKLRVFSNFLTFSFKLCNRNNYEELISSTVCYYHARTPFRVNLHFLVA